jgi:hypothetical protein
MQLDLTTEQAFELWTTLTLRVEQLRKDRELHSELTIIGAIVRRQLGRTVPVFNALNAYIEANAMHDFDDQDEGDYHPHGDPQI